MSAYSGTPAIVRWWEVGDRYQKRQEISKDLTITISSQGGATNTIGKTALGFTTINTVQLINFTDSGPQNRGIILWTDGTNVYLGDPQVSTDADRCEPIDLSGTLTFRITGLTN
jgi:hypothetical protein